jgi:hypothetical protein
VNRQLVGSVQLAPNGSTVIPVVGRNVTLLTRNGLGVSARVVNAAGLIVPAQVRNNAATGTTAIYIREGGTVFVVVLRTRVV